jgi:hypothetical protein
MFIELENGPHKITANEKKSAISFFSISRAARVISILL